MIDIVKQLRDEWPYILVEGHNVTDWEEVERQRAKAADEIEVLRRFIREIYEVYAGSEGLPEPIYASEAYLFNLIKEMVKIASEALSYKTSDES